MALVFVALAAACDSDSSEQGADASLDATLDADLDATLACPAPQVVFYDTPGCGADAVPRCGGPYFDACGGTVCDCEGHSVFQGCGTSSIPFASWGPCPGDVDAAAR